MKNNFSRKLLATILSVAMMMNSSAVAFAADEGANGAGSAIGTSSVGGETGKPETPPAPDAVKAQIDALAAAADAGEAPDADAVKAARAAYDALTDEEKAAFDPDTLALLVMLEAALAAVPMAGDAITITVNTDPTLYGGATLKAAVTASGVTASSITALKITAGEVTTDDWNELKTAVPALETFEIDAAVTPVANIPTFIDGLARFPTSITSVTVPQAITVGDNAFEHCTALTTVDFPAATSIGMSTFFDCTSLTDISSLSAVTNIGGAAFNGCAELTTVSLPEATSIGYRAFYGCKKLTSVSLPKATDIGEKAFERCALLAEISLPAATSIGEKAFTFCQGLTEVNLPAVTTIGAYAFGDLSKLATLKLGATVPTTVDSTAFSNCKAKDKLVLVDADGSPLAENTTPKLSVVAAAYDAVDDGATGYATDGLWYGWKVRAAPELPKITITVNGGAAVGGASLSDAVTKALNGAAASTITSLKITAGEVTAADWNYFAGGTPGTTTSPFTALQTFEAEAAVTTVADIPNGDSQAPIFPTTITSVIIPQAIKVGNYAFLLCTKLGTVSLPKASSIGEEAFYGCRALVTVSLPEVTSIGNDAFSGCTKLGTVSLPEATSIGNDAFYGCRALVTVSLPAATSIGEKAFSGCIALTSVSLPKATSIGEKAFNGCTVLATVSLPAATSIVFQAFNGCSALATLKLGATVPTVDAYLLFGSAPQTNPLVIVDVDGNELTDPAMLAAAIAAYKAAPDGNITDGKWCGWTLPAASELPKITITVNGGAPVGGASLSDAVTKALKGANASTITSLKITAGEVTDADWKALKVALPALTSFEIDAAVTTVADIPDAQMGTPIFPKSIATVRIPQAITVGDYAFNNCIALNDVYLYGATDIGAYAFDGCGKLGGVTLLAATKIGEGAFNGCTWLGRLKLGATVPKVADATVFAGCPKPSFLVIADANGSELTESTNPKLSVVAAAYDKVVAPDTGTDTDGLWYGWEVREPIVASWAATGGGAGEDTLENAVEAVKATGGTVTLLTNVEDLVAVDIYEEFTKPVTLVLNGKTLNGLVAASGNTGVVTVDGTIAGSKIQSAKGMPAIHCTNPNLKLKGGTYVGDTATSTPAIIMLLESSDPGEVEKLKTLLADGYKYENENGFAVMTEDGQPAAITGNAVKVVPTVSVAVTGVTLNKTTLSLEAGKNETLTATVAPENATNKAVTWTSNAPTVATVDENGKVTAVAVGSATITVTTTDGGKTATCAVTVTAVAAKPAPGGKLEAPLTQDKVDGVFGEGNATLDNTATPPKITIDNSIIPEKPIEIETDVTIDLGGNTITGKPGQPGLVVGDGDKVTVSGGGTVSGGDNPGGAGGNGITGGAGSDITIGGGVTVEGGDGGAGGDGINSGGNVSVDGSVSGGSSSSGNGGDGVDTSTGSGDITIGNGGSANGGNSTGGNGNGGDGTSSGGNTIIGGDVTGGNGNGSGSGGNGTTTGSGDTTISGGGSATGGTGGNASSGTGGAGGNGSTSTGGGSIEVGGKTEGGNGGSGSTGGTGGNGTSTDGSTTVTGGGTATGGTGGSGSTSGGNGGNGASSGSTTVNGGAAGGSGGSGKPGSNGNGGNGGSGVNQGSGTVEGSGTATGGNGGSGAGTGSGGNGGAGVGGGAKPGDNLIVQNGISAKVEVVGDAKTEVKLPDPAKTVNAILTPEEKADPTITDVKVTLKVDDKTAAKPDQAAVESKKPANSVIGAFFDITLQKTITKNNVVGSPETVTNVPNGVVTITIEIPSAMQGGSDYVIIRVHNGTGEALTTTQSGNELTFETNKFSTYAIAYTPAGTPDPDPGPGPNPNPGPSGGGSGGSSGGSSGDGSGGSSSDDGYDFWMTVKEKIQNAHSGDVVKVNAKGYDKMPSGVMDALRKNSGVSLVITWSGKTITIPTGKAQKNESGRIYWPLSKLVELYANIAEDAVLKPAEQTNPTTGGPGKYIPVTGGGELITLEAPSPTIENTLPNGTENTQAIAPTQPKAITSPDAGFEQDAFAGTPDAKQATDSNAFAVIALMLAVAAVGSGVWFWKKRHENEQSSGT